MLAALPRLLSVRLLAALLLAVVGLQAGGPMERVLERGHGSAFSASTQEVALAAQRRTETVRHSVAPMPVVPAPVQALSAPAPLPALPALPAPRPASTGPPAPNVLSLKPAPRAPPLA